MQKAEQTEEQQTKKRKKKVPESESGKFHFVNTFERLWNTEAAYGYKKKKLVEDEADKLAERYKKEGIEDQIWNISTEIRHYFPEGDKYEEHKNYVTHILRDYKHGIYKRKYDKETVRDPNARDHPLEDTNATTQRISESLEEQENTDPYDLSPNGVRDLMDRHLKEYSRLRKHCKDNGIEIDIDNDINIDQVRAEKERARKTLEDFEKPVEPKRHSQGIPPLTKDEAIKELQNIEIDRVDQLIAILVKFKEVIKLYPPDYVEAHRNLVKGLESLIQIIRPYVIGTRLKGVPELG